MNGQQIKKNIGLRICKQVISPVVELKKQDREIVRLERKIFFSDSDLQLLESANKQLNCPVIAGYLDSIKTKEKNNILDYLSKHNIILCKLQDSNSDWQVAIIQADNNYYLNNNLDGSYGQQSENPRLTRQGLLNCFINFNLQTEQLNNNNIIWIQSEILEQTDNLERFDGMPIMDRGFYDNPTKSEKSNSKSDYSNNIAIFN